VSVGEALAEARRQAGLSLTQVSDQTRIRETIIAGIEGNDYSECGGDSSAREYIRSIARAVGADAEPLIEEYDTARPGPQPASGGTAEPVTFTRRGEWLWRAWLVVVVLVTGGLWFVALQYHAGPHHAVTAASSPRALPVAHRHPGHRGQASPARPPTLATTAPGRTLTPVSAAAFGPSGTSQGDNSDLAHLAIDANPATAWHTAWYATARFGNLYPGTGLLVDMGRPATITAARVTLGRAHGAGLQLRVGTAPALADLPPVAHQANASGVVRLRLATPARGRYVLVWFTRLPPDRAGTFQARVYNLRLEGQP
jgi:cytoskeletal protein RodZ